MSFYANNSANMRRDWATLPLSLGTPDPLQSLKSGKVLLMLCDTIYGLVSKAPEGYRKIQDIKGRLEDKPFLQLFANLEQLDASPWQLPSKKLQQYWPGPLTCVLSPKLAPQSQAYIKATKPYCWQDSQAVRIPQHKLLQELCLASGGPLYSSSANRSGQTMPETIKLLLQEFAPEIANGLIITSLPLLQPATTGSTTETKASTIVDARCDPPQILRQGDLVLNL